MAAELRKKDFRVTDAEGRYITDSDIERLRLHLDILGVCYERINDQPGVKVLLQATFILPKKKHLEYARLPFQGLPYKEHALDIWVEALTPEGEEVEYLGVYSSKVTNAATPQLTAGVTPVDLSFSGVGKTEEITQEIPHKIWLMGHRGGMGLKSHWEFHNDLPNGKELRHEYPKQIHLVAAFGSTHTDDHPFPFYLRFSSDCQVTIMDHISDKIRHLIGKPRQYQFEIRGRYRENNVREYIRENKCGLVAAVKEVKERMGNSKTNLYPATGAAGET